MNRHRELAQMMRAAAGPPPVSPFPWVHKWDFTAESGGLIPDLIAGASLTLGGSYTADATGLRPTSQDARAVVPVANLGIDIGFGTTDTYTVLMAVANIFSTGTNNTYGRFYEGYSSSANRGVRVWTHNSLTVIEYQNNYNSTLDLIVPNLGGKPSCAATGSNAVLRVWVSGSGVTATGTTSSARFDLPEMIFMNREALDRAPDALVVGAGIISQILTDQELIDATAELLAL